MSGWTQDVLGAGWQQTTLDLGTDDEGPVVATLVRRARAEGDDTPGARPAVLYLHGFNDYFFQIHLAEVWEGRGYEFYALDLRKCGRSLRPWQTPHYCTDLRDYQPELDAATRMLRGVLGHDRLVVLGHSTGGLLASLWAHSVRNTGVLDALVLNSPWFELNAPWVRRVVSTRLAEALGPIRPRRVLAHGASAYTRRLHVSEGGRWQYDLALKVVTGVPVRAGWLLAIRRGHSRLARGLDISAPVLVCTAATSGPNREDNPDHDRQDTVLDVEQIAARAHHLGRDVTVVRIPDAIHDLALSDEPARTVYLDTVFRWLDDHLPR